MHRSLIAVALLLLAPLATAQVYKWKDAGGTVHYSQSPPAQGTKYLQVKTTGPVQPTAAAPAAAASSMGSSDSNSASAAPTANTSAANGKMCGSLKSNLAALQGSAPVVMQQDGKTVVLDPEQRKLQANAAQSQYDLYCQAK